MADEDMVPPDLLAFIQRCVNERRMFWTYHVNMRMGERAITRGQIIDAVDSYKILEAYPKDKYLPSYLVYARAGSITFHVLFAVDRRDQNVRVVTAYRPEPTQWSSDFKTRREP
ncbi:MAG TPA: DUF4258 domain-containing protein [Nitrospira sp.]|nr:DUF4258 domain-containing protein [Nitrospira sp.]